MPLISDNFHKEKLKKFNINIKTKYYAQGKTLERNTDDSYNDNISQGIRFLKEYYVGGKLLHTEKLFDSRIEYSFISKELDSTTYKCPNCGFTSTLNDFIDGCPYCGTYYNIDYTNKDLGSKYHYDLVLKKTTYRVITALVDLVVSIILTWIFIVNTSRSFNVYDISKIFIYGVILSLILYYLFYVVDGYVVLGPIKRYKDKVNLRQMKFWEKSRLDKKNFFNNLNYEIRKMYYSTSDIVDFDILDYNDFKYIEKDGKIYVKVSFYVRVVYFKNGKFKSKYIDDNCTLLKVNEEALKLDDGANLIKCHKCGASVDARSGKCEYCGSEIMYLQNFIICDQKELL